MKKTFFLLILVAGFSNAFAAVGDKFFAGTPSNYYTVTSETTVPMTVAVTTTIGSIDEKTFEATIAIPEKVTNTLTGKTYTVTSISDDAFHFSPGDPNTTTITAITMPNTVTSIGAYAFANLIALKTITISNSITTIKSNTFNSCTSLSKLDIPASVTSIGAMAFFRCASLSYNLSKKIYGYGIFFRGSVPPTVLGQYGSNSPFGINDFYSSDYIALSTIKLHVPVGNTAYAANSYWSSFNIVQDITAIENPTETDYLIKTADKSVEISNIYGKSIKVFDLSGRIVFETHNAQETEQFTVSNKGIYVISIDNFRKKIAIY